MFLRSLSSPRRLLLLSYGIGVQSVIIGRCLAGLYPTILHRALSASFFTTRSAKSSLGLDFLGNSAAPLRSRADRPPTFLCALAKLQNSGWTGVSPDDDYCEQPIRDHAELRKLSEQVVHSDNVHAVSRKIVQ